MTNITRRKATLNDLPRLIKLLLEDELGQTRESRSTELDENYIKAFHKIDSDPNQYLTNRTQSLPNNVGLYCRNADFTCKSIPFLGGS